MAAPAYRCGDVPGEALVRHDPVVGRYSPAGTANRRKWRMRRTHRPFPMMLSSAGANMKTILNCPGCQQKLRVPTDKGSLLQLRCPKCAHSWDWSVKEAVGQVSGNERLAGELLLRWEELYE